MIWFKSSSLVSAMVNAVMTMSTSAMAWAEKRNAKEAKVDWRFTTRDARIKPKKLYPTIE